MNSHVISQSSHRVVYDEAGTYIIEDNNILIQNKLTEELIFIPLNNEVREMFQILESKAKDPDESEMVQSEEECTEADAEKIWNASNVLFLIHKIEEAQAKFDKGIKKNVWIEIAKKCSNEFGKHVTFQNCDSKWKSLKRTYRSILLHNSTSGKQRRRWEFFDAIHNFMANKPEIQPYATCSNIADLKCDLNNSDGAACSNDLPENPPETEENDKYSSSFSTKRKAQESAIQVRHREKMARQDRFNDLFKELIDKL